VLFLSVLHFIGDEENPGQIVAGFRDRLPAGGYLVISAITSEDMDEETASGASDLYRSARTPAVARSREQIMEFFADCELEEPGLVNLGQWRPDTGTDTRMTGVNMLAGVGRKR
jgi:S-adenosyl methyltransferase